MYHTSLKYLAAIVISCGLLLQSCKSGFHIATGDRAPKRTREKTVDHVQEPGRAPLSGTLPSLRTDACVNDALASVSSADPVASVVPTLAAISISGSSTARVGVISKPQPSVRPFEASSLPSAPCVRVGELGLLRRIPTQPVPSPAERWFAGPTMQLDGDAEKRAVCRIPSGYRFKGYRLRVGSVIRHACLTINYIAANDEEAYWKLESAQNAYSAATSLDAHVGQVVTLGTLEDGVDKSYADYHKDQDLQCAEHVGLVLYGSARRDGSIRKESKIDTQVEILLEKMTEDSSVHHDARVPIPVFGAKEWARYFGEVGEEPPLPSDIDEILNSPCPFWPEKTVKDTHLLVLIPSTVDGEAFTLDLLEDLAKYPSEDGHYTQYFLYDDEVQRSSGDVYSSSSYWVLLTRDVLPGSRSKPYTTQQALISGLASHIRHPSYETPLVLEVATAILSHYVRSGDRLYEGREREGIGLLGGGLPNTSTRCAVPLEGTAGHISPVTVGRFCSRGLVFLSGFGDDVEFGISCLRQFGTRSYRPSALLCSFGAEEWCRYFGEVGSAPPLPENIIDILSSPCPFWPEAAIKDTHLLVLIPARVAGRPFSLNLLGELVKRPKGGGHSTKYECYDSDVRKVLGTQSPAGSYWILMTRDVLGDSRNRSYTFQKNLVAHHASRTGLPYALPGILEATTAILSHYVRSGERLYGELEDDAGTCTRCQDLVDNRCRVVVGGFSPEGFGIDVDANNIHHVYGAASLRKL
jgi:hypothetical protein